MDPEAFKKEWKDIFSTMDQDQSGSITCNELYKFIVKVTKMENGGEYQKVDREEVRAIFKNLDKDGDRSVEWEEFFDVVTSKAKDKQWRCLFEKSIGRKKDDKFSEDKVREMFYSIDKDRSGDITVKVKYSDINNYAVTIVDIRLQEALRACRRTSVMGHLGVDDVEEWLKLTDKDGDGTISYEEFKFAFVGTNMLEV